MSKCICCGKEFDPKVSHFADFCSDECFYRDFWNEKVELVKEGQCVVVEGGCYFIGREDVIGDRGYNGRLHFIKCNDGRLIRSTNVWYNGRVPEMMKSELPDNAEFISRDEYEKLIEEEK